MLVAAQASRGQDAAPEASWLSWLFASTSGWAFRAVGVCGRDLQPRVNTCSVQFASSRLLDMEHSRCRRAGAGRALPRRAGWRAPGRLVRQPRFVPAVKGAEIPQSEMLHVRKVLLDTTRLAQYRNFSLNTVPFSVPGEPPPALSAARGGSGSCKVMVQLGRACCQVCPARWERDCALINTGTQAGDRVPFCRAAPRLGSWGRGGSGAAPASSP